ncbi:hypothetical protein CK203_065310 [Vitis vinifera]|uniref:Uncharacterized protein n=1 Tax=Vitis vinifera TaxID=29760 RepID=A0A438FNN1_VITVI|nr:hypothetical protein CK203_065310 [Vitis vinifera]
MRLWRKCWQISRVYGQPKGHRSQPGSSQGSHGNTSSQEQERVTTPHRQARCVRTIHSPASLMSCDPSSWQYEKLERTDGRTVAKTL